MARSLTDGLLVFAVALVAFELSVNGVWQTDHSTSFVQLDYALWHDHSFALTSATRVPPWSVDDFLYRGRNFSALAPGTAILALPFAGIGFSIAGGYTAFGPLLLVTEAFVALTGAVSAYLVFALVSLYFRRSASIFLGFAFAFSTTLWPMATYFFQSDVSAMLVLLAANLGVRAIRQQGSARALTFLAGLAAGVAFTVDYVTGVLLPILLAFLVMRKRRSAASRARSALAFVIGTLPGLAAVGFYNYSIFGSPFVSTEQAYLGSSSVLSSFTTSPAFGLPLDLVSLSRGVLVFAPFLVLGVIGYIEALRNRSVRFEMSLFLAIFLGILIPYSMWRDPFGGLSFGPRFLVAAIPFLILPAGFVVEHAKGWRKLPVYGLYVAGVVMNGMAALVSAIPVTSGFNDFTFLSVILPDFLRGNLDTVWGFGRTYASAWGALLIVSLAVVVPIFMVELARRGEDRGFGTRPS